MPSGPNASAPGAVSSGAAAAVRDALADAAGDAGGLHRAGPVGVALQERDGVAGRGDVDVAPARGDRDRRRLCRARGPWRSARPPPRRMQPVGPGCWESAPVVGIALQHRDRVGVLGRPRRAWRRPARSRAHRRPASARPERQAPGSAPPRTQAWRPPSWSRAPPVGSSENDGDGVGVPPGHVQAAAVGRDRERGRAEQADARGAAAAAAGPHAAGGAAQLRQRTGLDVTREGGHGARDGRDGIEMAAVGRERRSARRRSGRGHARSPFPSTTRRIRAHPSAASARPSWRCAGTPRSTCRHPRRGCGRRR